MLYQEQALKQKTRKLSVLAARLSGFERSELMF
jgi:hypothetical protein